jgi:spermidine synthase
MRQPFGQGDQIMIKRELLGTAKIPSGQAPDGEIAGGGELKLYRHDRDFMIVLGHNELMSSRQSGSEVALATMTADRLAGRAAPHLLIGGYGMGFTLRAALAKLGKDAQITLAELVPEVIDWARGPMKELAAGCLDDPRVTLDMDDVADVIAASPHTYDAILLDVDNGPDGLVRAENNRIYSMTGLKRAKHALRAGGLLAIWSAAPDKSFAARLGRAGFTVEEVRVAARANGKGAKHMIWFAKV